MTGSNDIDKLIRDHSRNWGENSYVYPVISRRAHGMSIGINLSPDKLCNFRCVYCQVDRSEDGQAAGERKKVELPILIRELNQLLDMVADGVIWMDGKFAQTPVDFRRLNDIAFSGDGEPTLSPRFADAVTIAADSLARHKLKNVKLVVITNATRLHTVNFKKALDTLTANNGELWCKLDAGSQNRYQAVNRSSVKLEKIVDNIADAACKLPVAIQSCLFSLDGEIPDDYEMEMYTERIGEILERGGQIKQIQLYTLARKPAEDFAQPISKDQLEHCASIVRSKLVDIPVDVF